MIQSTYGTIHKRRLPKGVGKRIQGDVHLWIWGDKEREGTPKIQNLGRRLLWMVPKVKSKIEAALEKDRVHYCIFEPPNVRIFSFIVSM